MASCASHSSARRLRRRSTTTARTKARRRVSALENEDRGQVQDAGDILRGVVLRGHAQRGHMYNVQREVKQCCRTAQAGLCGGPGNTGDAQVTR
eukprot:scaffold105544_cov51-Phaeocystis_antarctica.AAC.1